jgi:hypothetical protein
VGLGLDVSVDVCARIGGAGMDVGMDAGVGEGMDASMGGGIDVSMGAGIGAGVGVGMWELVRAWVQAGGWAGNWCW